ncbi:membrane-associated protein, putative [Bodo saltans]|uniref:Membrane-associated protein, putative n=1 Tax=Bodo saltans TaxID=75058 RepID=A0A0S4JES0_BODSA|nr:membrane-associated protein, putative [Bodo saltans]|eukprot:CUG87921.1 membrane-associated protein, putative [Bodo saltans]
MFHELLAPVFSPLAVVVRSLFHVHPLRIDEAAYVLAGFFLLWCVVGGWAYVHYARKKSDEYGSRVISVIHASISSVLCFLGTVEEFNEPEFGTFGAHCSGLQQVALLCTAGYFAMDMLGILMSSYFSWLYVGHHILSGGCLAYGGLVSRHGFEFAMVTCLMEVSNPLLHSRWLLIADKEHLKNQGKGSLKFRVIDQLFYVVFFVARIMMGPILTAHLVVADNTPLIIQAAGVLLQVLSVQFMFDTFSKRFRGDLWIN